MKVIVSIMVSDRFHQYTTAPVFDHIPTELEIVVAFKNRCHNSRMIGINAVTKLTDEEYEIMFGKYKTNNSVSDIIKDMVDKNGLSIKE